MPKRTTSLSPNTRPEFVIGVDPGYEQSAVVVYNWRVVLRAAILRNSDLLSEIQHHELLPAPARSVFVFEKIEHMGMIIGREVMETIFVTGQMYAVAQAAGYRVDRLPRRPIKLYLCGSPRAKDANIRAALIDYFGGKDKALGRKHAPGPLYGVHSHEWAALAVAVTWWDTVRTGQTA